LDQKFPTVWEKMSENLRGGIFLTHTVDVSLSGSEKLDQYMQLALSYHHLTMNLKNKYN